MTLYPDSYFCEYNHNHDERGRFSVRTYRRQDYRGGGGANEYHKVVDPLGKTVTSGYTRIEDAQAHASRLNDTPEHQTQVTNRMVQAGSRVRFKAPLSNGEMATWTAEVVKVVDGVAFLRHPASARNMPFSPVPKSSLYKYNAAKLANSLVKQG